LRLSLGNKIMSNVEQNISLKMASASLTKIILLSVVMGVFAQPTVCEAGSLMKSLGKAATKRVVGKTAIITTKKLAWKKPVDVIIPRSKYPQTAAHINEAQRLGQPSILTIDRAGASAQRRASMKYIDRPRDRRVIGRDRDEYPPAMTKEGGGNADVRYINSRDNRGAGRSFAHQVRNQPDGGKVRVIVKD
jgi:hypothetical protein